MASERGRTDTREGAWRETSSELSISPARFQKASRRRKNKKMASRRNRTETPEDAEKETSPTPSPQPSKARSKQHKHKRSPSPEWDSKAGENKLRPAQDIINRIIWDSELQKEEYVIGYADRFDGELEVGMANWKNEVTDEEFIPQHRILYIKKRKDVESDVETVETDIKKHIDGDIVWDRRRRIDKIFFSGNSASEDLAFLA